MKVSFELTGTSPLLMHNPRMVDPEFSINRELKSVASKRNKTDDDHQRIEMLEWFGGLYDENGVIVQPTAKLRKSLIEAARITKQGKTVERALALDGVYAPLEYEGPRSPDEVFATGNGYISRLSVVVSGKRIMRVRPQFMPWGLSITGTLIDDAGLNFDDLERIASLAGTAVGIGDNRVNGYGRYEVKVQAV